jgi:hypothetical protein
MEVEGSLHSMIVIAVIAVLAVDVVESLSVLNFVLLSMGSLHQHHGKT